MHETTETTSTTPNADKSSHGCLSKITNTIIGFLEDSFGKFGFIVGTHPVKTILISVVFALLCLAGLLRHEEESRGEKLWIDQDSTFIVDQTWVLKQFPTKIRYINLIVKRNDILTPKGLLELLKIDKLIKDVYKDSKNTGLHWSNISYNSPPQTLLQFFSPNETSIGLLTKDDMVETLNQPSLISLVTNQKENVSRYLGDITGNSTHKVVKAGVTKLIYFLKRNDVLDSKGAWKDDLGSSWEKQFAVDLAAMSFPESTVYFSTRESLLKAGLDAIGNDFGLLFSGYALIIAYIMFQLGKFSRLQHKVWLAITGVLCVGLAVGVSYGLCAAAGVKYGPVHSVLPFLLLGIGVDDIFVIIQTWDNRAGSMDDDEPIAKKISRTMRHAGVAITVTSFTDVCAFLIGATTVLPALRWFCIYAGVGILMLYIFATSFFVAFLAIDAKRQRMRREACCYVKLSDTWQPLECSKAFYLRQMINFCSKGLLSIPGKVVIILLTCTLLGFGIYGLFQLNQDFDPDWFLPRDSDEVKYRNAHRQYFPSFGIHSAVYIGEIDYFQEQQQLHKLYTNIKAESSILPSTVKSWYEDFIASVKSDPSKISSIKNETIPNKEVFYSYLKSYLDSSKKVTGANVVYKGLNNSVKIKASKFLMTHADIEGTNNQINAMDSIRDVASSVHFQTGPPAFANGAKYIQWETNRIIGQELVRNLSLASACVFLVTLLLIANLWTSLLVLVCVACTLVDICGFMYFWDLSIDTIISTILVIALGFAVDYAAHIGHAFMAARKGSRNDRAREALVEIGPAVFNGGISTFLAFCLLAVSESYAFQTFFKVFFLVVTIGLWHGLVFLPVLLGIAGPKPYSTSIETGEEVAVSLDNGKVDANKKTHYEMNKNMAIDNTSYMAT